MDVTDELIPHNIFECYVWVIHFSIYGLFAFSCSFDIHVYIPGGNNEIIWYIKLSNLIKMDDRVRVTTRP